HSFLPLLAIPERPHVCLAFPERDRVARIWIALVSRKPLALEPLHISSQRCCLFVSSFKAVPLASGDPSPNDTHVHVLLLLASLQTHEMGCAPTEIEDQRHPGRLSFPRSGSPVPPKRATASFALIAAVVSTSDELPSAAPAATGHDISFSCAAVKPLLHRGTVAAKG